MERRDDGLYLGLISGTSAASMPSALVRFEGDHCTLVAGHTSPWDNALRARLVALGQGVGEVSLDTLGELDVAVAEAFADAALQLLDKARVAPRDVRAIGSHGQTVRHRPAARHPFTMQLGDGNRRRCRCRCVRR